MSTTTSVAELQRMTPDELRREINLHRTEYAKMRMGIQMQKEKNHALFLSKRREIARMETVMTQMRAVAKPVKKAAIPAKKASQVKEKSVKSTGSKSKKS